MTGSKSLDKVEILAIHQADSNVTSANRWDHFLARWGVNRMGHRIEPGLYSLGDPTADSPVFVTANYTLSFDALRAALKGVNAYVLVLDTQGINVWCAAGKGTFGTDELVHRIEASNLNELVNHRVLILPQLAAPGVAAHEVKRRSGFKVEYGPIRATDLPEYLKTYQATPEMRKVSFTLLERLVLIPVEAVQALKWLLIALVVLFLLNGMKIPIVAISAFAVGLILFPILLPWIPTSEFSTKGFILGAIAVSPFALLRAFSYGSDVTLWRQITGVLSLFLEWAPVTAFLALNFTGSTPFTSRTGVRREIFKYIPIMAWMFGAGIVLEVVRSLVKF